MDDPRKSIVTLLYYSSIKIILFPDVFGSLGPTSCFLLPIIFEPTLYFYVIAVHK